jgi:hypothetical protein
MKTRLFIVAVVCLALVLVAAGLLFFHASHITQRVSAPMVSSSPQTQPMQTTKSCPTGYILVPGSALYYTPDFCVMKYDAKCADSTKLTVGLEPRTGACAGPHNGTYKNDGLGCACHGQRQVVSTATGFPITYIPEDDGTQDSAKEYCMNLGGHLITNNEWMTIARNVETVNANWCNRDGTGCGATPGNAGKILANGHNDSSNEIVASNGNDGALIATDDAQPCFGTTTDGSNVCGGKGSQKRTLTLTNGSIIWDFAGNVWHWVDFEIARKDQPQSYTNGKLDQGWIWSDFSPGAKTTVIANNGTDPPLGYDAFRPTNPNWNSNNGVGRIYHYSTAHDTDTTLYTDIRGGNWRHGYDSGAFTAHLSPQANKTHIDDVGFRCVISLD